MRSLRRIWNERNDNFFKQTHLKFYDKLKNAIATTDPAEKLTKYKSLQESFKNLYCGVYGGELAKNAADNIKLSANKLLITRGPAGLAVGAGAAILAGIALPLAPIIVFAAAGVLTGSINAAAIHLAYRRQAIKTGLTAKDVKYVIKTRDFRKQIDNTVRRLSVQAEIKKTLEASKRPAVLPPPSR